MNTGHTGTKHSVAKPWDLFLSEWVPYLNLGIFARRILSDEISLQKQPQLVSLKRTWHFLRGRPHQLETQIRLTLSTRHFPEIVDSVSKCYSTRHFALCNLSYFNFSNPICISKNGESGIYRLKYNTGLPAGTDWSRMQCWGKGLVFCCCCLK